MFTYREKNSKGKVVPVHAMKTHSRSRDILPVIPNLSTRWRGVISFTLRPFYP